MTLFPERWKKELTKSETNVNWVYLTQLQIKKDFEMLGIEINFNENFSNPYESIFIQIKPIIEKLWNENHTQYQNLLYRIDLVEVENVKEDYIDIITDAIIKREFMKVWYKNHY